MGTIPLTIKMQMEMTSARAVEVSHTRIGTERPLTADELLDEINMPEVEYEEDGTVWVYYLNQKMEITDKFEDGVCFVQLKADGQTQYITVKYQNGYATSPDGYIQPDKFN